MRPFLYVLSTAAEPEVESYAPIDVCEGVFVDRYKADERARASLNERSNNAAFSRELQWLPFLDQPPQDDCWKLISPTTDEVFAVIEHAFYDRRAAGDRRRG